jgi:hypothetical protein
MKRVGLVASIAILSLSLGGLVGFRQGQRQGIRSEERLLAQQLGFTMSLDVEVASCIRVGDRDRALALLERSLDRGLLNLATRPAVVSDSVWEQARAYRAVVAAEGPTAARVVAALARARGGPGSQPCPKVGGRQSESGLFRLTHGAGR